MIHDRRRVLKAMAGLGALAAARPRGVLGANDRVRVGLIGIGLIGKRHLLDFMAEPDVEIAGISDVYEPRLDEGVALSGGKAARYPDFRAMFDRKDIDVVVVSTPDHWHALMTILACAAGKDVYVEKPLTHVVEEGRWMIRTAKHHKRVVQVGTQQRSGEQYKKCVDLLRAGHIGDLRSVRISSFRNVMPGFSVPVGDRPLSDKAWDMWLGPAPFVPFDRNRCLYHFRWFWDYSGGQTTNLLSHNIDIVQWAAKAVPRAVAAMGGRYSLGGIGETPDVFEALLEYPGFVATWSSRELSAGARGGLEFFGTKGSLTLDRAGFEVRPDRRGSPEDQIPRFAEPAAAPREDPPWTEALKGSGYEQVRDQFRPHVRNFLDCVKSRQDPVSDLAGAHDTSVACHLANIAHRVGRLVRWDGDREEIVGDPEASRLLTKTYRAPWDRELRGALPRS